MPEDQVGRALEYVGLLLLFSLASTFPWWAAANLARTEYRRLMSAVACALRIFFYSVCLLCIVVAAISLHIGPTSPQSRLFAWLHLGGTAWITIPSAWRAFRVKGPRLVLVVGIGWLGCAALAYLAWMASPGFREVVERIPRYIRPA